MNKKRVNPDGGRAHPLPEKQATQDGPEPPTLARAFDILASVGGDFLPDGRDQGTAETRETF